MTEPKQDIKQQVGSLIREARERKGLTQSELAELMGATKGTVSNLEANRYSPTIKTVSKAAAAMGLTLRLSLE